MGSSFSVTSAKVVNDNVYVALVNVFSYTVSRLREDPIETLTRLDSNPYLILWGSSESLLVSSGNTPYLAPEMRLNFLRLQGQQLVLVYL